MTTGGVKCWGFDYSGQLGDGKVQLGADTPTQVVGLETGVDQIAVDGDTSCAMTTTRLLLCWGDNAAGQLGNGTFAVQAKPAVVLGENGAGTITGNNWFLDLDPSIRKTVPPDKIPTFLAKAAGNAAADVVDVTVNLQFRAQDVGRAIYVFGYVPSSLIKRVSGGKDDTCVLAQLSPNGVPQQASSSTLQPYVTGVTTTQGQAVTVLSNVPATRVVGSTFCVGTGTNSAQSTSAGNRQCVVTVPPPSPSDPVCLPPDTANVPDALSGLWWNKNESGWGIHFTQRNNIVFAAWYTYNASGNPKWYVSTCNMPSGTAGTSGTCNGAIYEVSGPTFFGTTFNPQLANVVQNGNLQVSFQNADNASMTYSGVSGQTRTVPITRQPLASGAAPSVNYTDIWWGGQSESGWGMAITQEANTVFLAWYVYDSTGKPMWYVATCTLNGTTCSGDLLRTTGPAFGPTFNSSQVQSFKTGTVSVTFTDGNNAVLNYTTGGVTATKRITRQLF